MVWLVDKDRSMLRLLEKAMRQASIGARCFADARELFRALEQDSPDAVLTDIRIPGGDGLELLRELRTRHPQLPVILMTEHADLEHAVSAFRGGAFEYLSKPFHVEDAVNLVRRACSKHRPPSEDILAAKEKVPGLIGEAPAMQEVFRAIARLAQSHITVLLNGESGTGKELVARALHRHSPRSGKPFIALNMAAIPYYLVESELFGHERGAFTGAHGRRLGHFELANGGTLFLDEIGDMPVDLQTRLLRVLMDGEFFPVGAHAPTKVDVRIIAASHHNLEQMVAWGRFREDLYHRLNVIRIRLPALRERRGDIPLLLRHFLGKAARELNVETKVLRPETEAYLCRLDWPGNVRELENTCRWITVMAAGREVYPDDLPPELLENRSQVPPTVENWQDAFRCWVDQRLRLGEDNFAREALRSAEGILIAAALEATRGCKQDAAKLLGYGRNTLTRKLAELNLGD
jgi:two-component system nitrogen regulation response regulator GlnG